MKRWVTIIIVAALVPVLAVGGYSFWIIRRAQRQADAVGAAAGRKKGELDRTYKIKRDDLIIGLRLSGNISASKKHKLSLQANYRTRLLSVVDENTSVKEGDVLAVFETDELKERIDELRIQLSNYEKELDIAIENEKMQESSNTLDVKTAEDRLDQAVAALRKYQKFERSNTRNNLLLKITTTETAVAAAEEELEQKESDVSSSNESDEKKQKENEKAIRDLEDKLESARTNLDNAQMEYRAFQRYDNPIKLLKLESELEQSKLNLERVRITAASNLVQKSKQVTNLRQNRRRTATLLERYESYLPQMQLVAPADGIVIYADPDRRWGNPDVKTGMDIWKGLVILTIPEMSNLMVDFDLPEQYRSKTAVGDPVVITPDSLPNLKISGQISQVATLPVNQIAWDSNSPKVYSSRVTLDRQNERLVNGMSVQVEIISKILRGTIFIPVEAVFEGNGRFFVYAERDGAPKEITVGIGESNDSFVQITEGLAEGDVVYLYRPYQKKQSDDN